MMDWQARKTQASNLPSDLEPMVGMILSYCRVPVVFLIVKYAMRMLLIFLISFPFTIAVRYGDDGADFSGAKGPTGKPNRKVGDREEGRQK